MSWLLLINDLDWSTSFWRDCRENESNLLCLVIVNRKGVPHTVKIGRYANVIVDWMNKHSVNNSKEVRHCEQMVKLARSDDMLVAAYFGPTQASDDS